MSTQEIQKPRRVRRPSVCTNEEFVKVWQQAKSVGEVAEKLGIERAAAASRAGNLRKHHVPLKKFKMKKSDYEALAKLATSIES